jgi:hypothetical protein
MTTMISSVPGLGLSLDKQSASSYYNQVLSWISLVRRPSEALYSKEEAIRVLSRSTTEADRCEWAERHLCGMASADMAAFMEHQAAQS